MAVNCWVVPGLNSGFGGVTVSEVSAAGVTVNPVEPVIVPEVAWMVVLPVATAVASPPALMVATVVLVEVQVTVLVRFCVLPSE